MENGIIIYANEHRAAYERANNEVRLNLNRCTVCGDMVCEDCSVYSEKLGGDVCCKKCAEKHLTNQNDKEETKL